MSNRGEQEGEEPEPKKLRSSEPDLKIIVKAAAQDSSEEENGEGEGQPLEKEYFMYSTVMANHSKFVDASLSNEMIERATNTIIFSDVSPEIFDQAMEYLENPTKARRATVSDALQVIEFYDKYEFTGGIQFVDEILVDYYTEETSNPGRLPKSLDSFVNAIHMGNKCNLQKSTEIGITALDFSGSSGNLIHPRMLQEEHIAKLQPLFQEGKLDLPTTVVASPEEIASVLFPKYFVSCVRDPTNITSFTLNFESMPNINVRMINQYGVWGIQNQPATIPISGTCYKLTIKQMLFDPRHPHPRREAGDWAVFIDNRTHEPEVVVFKSPFSAHLATPPQEPWIPVPLTLNQLFANRTGKPILSSFQYN